jgi:RNA-directed DNA polymerase
MLDCINWELMLRAVCQHTNCPWVLLNIKRWLEALVQMEDGSVVPRGNAAGRGDLAPVLASLFLHYAFDVWISRKFVHIRFERYADDIISHCKSAKEARALWGAIG